MPYLTRKNLKLQLSPGLVTSYYDMQPGNGVGLLWDTKNTHTHTYLLTYLLYPDTHGENNLPKSIAYNYESMISDNQTHNLYQSDAITIHNQAALIHDYTTQKHYAERN